MSKLLKETLKLLNASKLPSSVIASNAGVNLPWLESVKYGRVKDPGVIKIEKLNSYLKKASKVV